jgi:hypothetical protein
MTRTGDLTNGSAVVTSVAANTTGLLVGMGVVGTGVPTGTVIVSVDSSSQFTMSQNATADGTGVTLDINTIFFGAGTAYAYNPNANLYIQGGLQGNALARAISANANLSVRNETLQAAGTAVCTSSATLEIFVPIEAAGTAIGAGVGTVTLEIKLQADVFATSTTSGSLTMGLDLLATGLAEANALVSMTDSAVPLQANARADGTAAANIILLHNLTAAALAEASANTNLSATLVLRTEAEVSATTSVYLSFVGQGLGVCNAINDILLLWGIEDARMSVEYLRERALTDLNAAMQLIWAQAKDRDYFSRQTLTVNVPSGQKSVELEQDVQQVLGPVRRASDKGNLRPLASRSQLDLFGHLFLGQTNSAVADGVPQAFFAERLNQNRPDNTRVILHVVPAPDENTNLLVDVAMECPRYEWRDYCQCTPLHIPHRYAESILLPICRHRAMSSHYFIKEERRELIENEYSTAMQVLGLVDPQLKEAEAAKEAGIA